MIKAKASTMDALNKFPYSI